MRPTRVRVRHPRGRPRAPPLPSAPETLCPLLFWLICKFSILGQIKFGGLVSAIFAPCFWLRSKICPCPWLPLKNFAVCWLVPSGRQPVPTTRASTHADLPLMRKTRLASTKIERGVCVCPRGLSEADKRGWQQSIQYTTDPMD